MSSQFRNAVDERNKTDEENPDSVRFTLVDLLYAALFGYAFSVFDASKDSIQTFRWGFAFGLLIVDYLVSRKVMGKIRVNHDFFFDIIILLIISRILHDSTAKELPPLPFVQTTDQDLKYWAAFFGWFGFLFFVYLACGCLKLRELLNYTPTLVADGLIMFVIGCLWYAVNNGWIAGSNYVVLCISSLTCAIPFIVTWFTKPTSKVKQ